MSSLFKVLVILFLTGLVAACKVAVIVVEGGEVQSIGSGTCAEGTICIVEVNDTNFSESFTAVPNPGWHFVKWNKGWGHLCGDSTKPTCVVSTEGTAGNTSIEAIISSDKTFYIMPVFEFEIVPDTVTVDGREWAQVDQFSGLSWGQINAVCPEGVCAGTLNGYYMTGWTWASVDDMNELFNYYIGYDELGPGPDDYLDDDNSEWVDAFFDDGWREHAIIFAAVSSVGGWVSDSAAYLACLMDNIPLGRGAYDFVLTNEGCANIAAAFEYEYESKIGAWFYRNVQ